MTLWPFVALAAVVSISVLVWRFLSILDVAARGQKEIDELRGKLSAYPPAEALVDDLEEVREIAKTLQAASHLLVKRSEIEMLLDRAGAEKIVANMNRVVTDLAEVKDFVDQLRTPGALRAALNLEDA